MIKINFKPEGTFIELFTLFINPKNEGFGFNYLKRLSESLI